MAECKLKVRTPKGQAKKAVGKIKWLVLGKVKTSEIYISKEDDEIVFFFDIPLRKLGKIHKNVAKFDFFVKAMLDNKLVRKTVRKHLKAGQEEDLKEMLLKHTEMELVSPLSPKEVREADETLWQRIKGKFRKHREEDEPKSSPPKDEQK